MRRKADLRYGAPTEAVIRRPAVGGMRAEIKPRGPKYGLARTIRPSVVMFEDADVIDDFPQPIPVAPRELDVIEGNV